MLTSTLYIDFGDNLPPGGLNITGLQIRDTFANGGIQGPPLLLDNSIVNITSLSSVVDFDYDQDGILGTPDDYSTLRTNILAVVQRLFAPFDVDVQVAPSINIATQSGENASDLYRLGIIAKLKEGANTDGEHDAWLFCSAAQVGETKVAELIGGLSGIASDGDLNRNNTQDNSAFVFADYMLHGATFGGTIPRGVNADTALGDNIAHEAGHTFGLKHAYNTRERRSVVEANSEVMGYGLDWTQYGVFTRYPLLSDYVDSTSSPSEQPGEAQIYYDRLINEGLLGPRADSPAYVTGTGAHDVITITSASGSTATVTIQAFLDTTHVTAIDVPGANGLTIGSDNTAYMTDGSVFSYAINTSNGIVIDGGEGSDRFVIDSDIAADVTVRGMAGVNSQLLIMGDGMSSGSYRPVPGAGQTHTK